jgi:hypothetical protein
MKLSLSSAVKRTPMAGVLVSSPRSSTTPPIELSSIDVSGLIDYQVPRVKILCDAVNNFCVTVDASDAGTGKTYMACAVARQLKKKLLIVCPPVVAPAWRSVAKSFGVPVADVLSYNKVRNGNTRWMKLKFGQTRRKVDRQMYWALDDSYLLVFDEGHACKGQDSQNSKLLIGAAVQKLRVIVCSATIATSPLEMKAVGFALGLHRLVDFWTWCKDHGAVKSSFGGLSFDKESESSHRVLLNIHKQIFPKRGTRVRISELGDAFPESQISAMSYEMGSNREKIQKAYDMMEAEMSKLDRRTSKFKMNALSLLTAARMQAEILKVPALLELVTDAIGSSRMSLG